MLFRKSKDSVADFTSGLAPKGEADEDWARIMAALPARKRAKLAAAKANISKDRSKDARENGAGSPDSSSDDKTNNDNCETCGGQGEFICCEGCPKAFHFVCVEPPMDAKDVANIKGKWFCNECQVKKHPPRINNRNIFGTLLYKLETSNPVLFELPKDIKQFFQGVTSNEYGEYVESGTVKSIRKGKNGQIEEPDYYRLRDKNGQSILCYRCRKSALRDKPIIACDYCPLYWHLDCLDPPLASAPNVTRKWMCPNHVEMAMHVRKRQLRNPIIVEPEDPVNTKNNGDIQIVDDNASSKWMTDQMLKYAGVVYRLPETAVKLHFVDHIRSLREHSDKWHLDDTPHSSQDNQQHDTASPSSSSTNEDSSFASTTTDRRINNLKVTSSLHPSAQESREWLEGLVALQSDIAKYLQNEAKNETLSDHAGLRMLIRAALGSEDNKGSTECKVEMDRATAEKYKAIEELIRIKGEGALLQFLTQKEES